jgi:hypothetical protein
MKTRREQADLLAARIEASGLTARRFAREVLRRDERTVRRWLTGERPIPAVVLDFIEYPQPAPWPPQPALRPQDPRF